jgi:hypothetical protein
MSGRMSICRQHIAEADARLAELRMKTREASGRGGDVDTLIRAQTIVIRLLELLQREMAALEIQARREASLGEQGLGIRH